MDHALTENVKLSQANRGIDDLLSAGSNILNDLTLQRGTLKVCWADRPAVRFFLPFFCGEREDGGGGKRGVSFFFGLTKE
jgi:hypothetical protein